MPIIQPIISGGGSAPSKYNLLDRVKDDNNNEIGTVAGFHTDANNVKYAVVALDAQYRNGSGQYFSSDVNIPTLTTFNTQALWDSTDTATSNCTKILDYITEYGGTSSAVSHCRSKSFVIDNITYYGQLPTIVELTNIFMNRTAINAKDTSASSYPDLIVPTDKHTWSSTQGGNKNNYSFYITSLGYVQGYYKYNGAGGGSLDYLILPVLEIPIN